MVSVNPELFRMGTTVGFDGPCQASKSVNLATVEVAVLCTTIPCHEGIAAFQKYL